MTIPGSPDAGYSGAGGLGGLDGVGTAALGGGTLPGTSISDRVLFAVDQATLSAEAIGILERPGRLADAEPERCRS